MMKRTSVHVCACGCGGLPKGTYLRGHARRGRINTEESNKRRSASLKRWLSTLEGKKAHSGKVRSEDSKKKTSISCKRALSSPEMREKLSASHRKEKHWNFGKTYSADFRKMLSAAHKGQVAWNKGRPMSALTKEKLSLALTGHQRSEASKLKQRLTILRNGTLLGGAGKRAYWAKQDYVSKPERSAEKILKDMGLDVLSGCKVDFIEHAYTADFYLPAYSTFVEIDGRYYHSEKHFPMKSWLDKVREKELKEKGYAIIRFWEDELSLIKERLCTLLGCRAASECG
jgi:very-short-patch-repair endonuclease